MFNYGYIERLQTDIRDLDRKLVAKGEELRQAEDRMRRYAILSGLATRYSALAHYWSYSQVLNLESDRLEQEAKDKAERDKVEAIMRDLLKSNVFKQV